MIWSNAGLLIRNQLSFVCREAPTERKHYHHVRDVLHHCQPSSVKRRRKYSHRRHGNVAKHDRISAGLPDGLTKNLICLPPFNGCRWIVTTPAYALHVLRLQYRSLPGCAMLIVVATGPAQLRSTLHNLLEHIHTINHFWNCTLVLPIPDPWHFPQWRTTRSCLTVAVSFSLYIIYHVDNHALTTLNDCTVKTLTAHLDSLNCLPCRTYCI